MSTGRDRSDDRGQWPRRLHYGAAQNGDRGNGRRTPTAVDRRDAGRAAAA
jgi:hypothetical protein